MAGPRYIDTCYYAASANKSPERPMLDTDTECDVCVIGGGFSGVSAALHLAEQGRSVILLEAEKIGWGASGRNGGQLVNGYSRGYDTVKKRYGEDTATALEKMSRDGAGVIRERVEKYGIACDLKPGNIFAAFTKSQMHELERLKETWETVAGFDGVEMFDENGLRDMVGTDIYVGGMIDRAGGHVHPLNLVLGQAAALESLGGTIYEGTRVTGMEYEDSPVVYTDLGSVDADYVIICGNAYLGEEVPELYGKTMPVSSQVITTEPLDDDMCNRMLPGDHCVEDCNYFLDYYRLTGDKRLLFGGGTVYGGADPADIVAKLRPHMLRTFPFLKDVDIPFAWSGNFALTLTRMPHVGRRADTVYFTHGYSGHGVTTSHLMGKLIAQAVQGQSESFDIFAAMKNYPFPGGQRFRVPLTVLGSWYYRLLEKLGI